MSRITRVPSFESSNFRVRGYHALWSSLSKLVSANLRFVTPLMSGPTTPIEHALDWFRLFRVRSPLLAESLLFSFPPGTEMVHFPGFALTHPMYSDSSHEYCSGGVPPFGNPRVKGCLLLTVAYRSLPRPSSPSKCQGIHRVPLVA